MYDVKVPFITSCFIFPGNVIPTAKKVTLREASKNGSQKTRKNGNSLVINFSVQMIADCKVKVVTLCHVSNLSLQWEVSHRKYCDQ